MWASMSKSKNNNTKIHRAYSKFRIKIKGMITHAFNYSTQK